MFRTADDKREFVPKQRSCNRKTPTVGDGFSRNYFEEMSIVMLSWAKSENSMHLVSNNYWMTTVNYPVRTFWLSLNHAHEQTLSNLACTVTTVKFVLFENNMHSVSNDYLNNNCKFRTFWKYSMHSVSNDYLNDNCKYPVRVFESCPRADFIKSSVHGVLLYLT